MDAEINKGKSVLIVDDEECIREFTGYILKKRGFTVKSAADGKEAIEKITRDKPDIIILDFAMPEMDGLQVCLHLKQYPDTQNIPIIFLSADVHIGERLKDMPGAAVKYLPKPCDIKRLLEQIENICG